ncbi:MAG: PAS domain S-box protein [Armatimonadetes bacterium]|nr:PAS domain S-box protein [Armatimonadota bacterium]
MPYADGLLGSNAYSLLNVVDFLCMVAGVYLFAVLYDRHRRSGHLLLAIGTGVLALRVVQNQLLNAPQHLMTGNSALFSCCDAIAAATAAILIAVGTLLLTPSERPPVEDTPLRKAILIATSIAALAGNALVWALPYWQSLQSAIRSIAGAHGLTAMQQGVSVAVAAAWLACAWIFWERRIIGPGLSRMYGAALTLWAIAILIQVPQATIFGYFWASQFIRVLGSMFVGNALAMLVYEAERISHERQRRLAVIDAVARTGLTAPSLDAIIKAATTEATRVMHAEGAAIYMLDTTERILSLAATNGSCAGRLAEEVHLHDDHPVANAARSNEPEIFPITMPDDEPYYGASCDAVAVPLTGVSDVVGVLVVAPPPGEDFTPDDIETLRSAGSPLAIIIQNMALLERIREARDRWQQTFDSITELVTVHDASGRISAANQAMADYLSKSPDELVGRDVEQVFGRMGEEVANSLRHCIETGQSSNREDMNWPGGRIHQVQVTPLKDASGEVIGCVRIARDVTARRHAADRVAQSERRYRELAEGASDIIYTHDLSGAFLYVNRRAVELFGYSHQEFAHLLFWDLVAPESATQARSYIDDLIAGREADQVELRMLCRDDSVIVIQLSASVMRRNGEPVGIHGIARDITAEKQLAEQLLQYERLASVGTLIAGIAHELNNPLTVISGYAQMLRSGLTGERAEEALATIREQAERCRGMAQDLLGFARRPDDHLTRMDVNRAVRGVLDLRAYDLRASNIEVITSLVDGLPAVLTEHGQLQQVIYNLVDNAHDAMAPMGKGTLRVSSLEENGSVILRIEDTGPGIPEAELDRIFEPFVTTKPRGEGTGLGLSICRNIVSMYGGSITASNRPEGGACFEVRLPPAAGTERPSQADSKPAASKTTGGSARVLIIEDETALAELVELYLTREGHTVVKAFDGETGLQKALEDDFDLIICDMQLPNMNGDEMLTRLLEKREDLADRVVIATGDVLSPHTRTFLEKTGLPHIHKPFTLEQLAQLVQARLEGRRPVLAQ